MGSKIPLPINGQTSEPTAARSKRTTIGVITNPNARASARVDIEVSGTHHVLREEVTTTPSDVPAALDRLLAYGVEAIMVNGGDGTLSSVIAHLDRRRVNASTPLPKLIPVLGGTNNSVAKDVGAVGRIAAVKKRVIAKDGLQHLRTVKRATIFVDKNGERVGCGFVFATGLIARFADAYYAGSLKGPAQAAKVVTTKLATALLPTRSNRAFWAFEPNAIQVDDSALKLPKGASLSYCSTIDTQILFFRPFLARATELVEKRRFNVLVNALPKTTVLRHFFKFVLGRFKGDGHALAVAKKLEISGTRRMMLDGEMFDVAPDDVITLSPGPVVEFICLAKR
ncbi:MAG: hypothetical protein IT381_21300 [Deltaproteobacteria bacterium]|nr:hypothetical protein [Deltaproteobacteria bacterium]